MRILVVLTLLCAACGGADPGLRATAPHPDVAGAVRADVALAGADGRALFAQRWLPAAGTPTAVLVVVHGLKDHSDRYAPLVERVVAAGFAVYALDLPGHGRSPGRRVDLDRLDALVDDAARLLAIARDEQPGLPAFVLGHSMGGVVAALLAERQPAIAGVVLSAPALGVDAPAFAAGLLGGLGGLPGVGRMPLFEPKGADFSSRREVVDDMARDPLVFNHAAPVHTAAALLGAAGRAWDHADRVIAPILILHGTGDRLTSPAASRAFLRAVGAADHTLRLYPGAWHDLVHEPVGGQVADDVIAWMEARRAGPATPAPLPAGHLPGERVGTLGRLAVRGAYVASPDAGGDLDVSLGLGVGRGAMAAAALEGRLDLGGDGGSAGYGVVEFGTRLGRAGWVAVGGGGGWLAGGGRVAAQADLAVAPPGVPLALHLRATGYRVAGASHVDAELTLRWPGDRTFWGRGRRGAGWTIGVRTRDGTDAPSVVVGLEVSGFD